MNCVDCWNVERWNVTYLTLNDLTAERGTLRACIAAPLQIRTVLSV